jgi:cytoskeletal protein CcmA (bactofilin family)
LTVADNADLNSDLDVDGVTNLDVTDIDGTLDVDGVSNLDSTDIDGTLSVDGEYATFNVEDFTVNSQDDILLYTMGNSSNGSPSAISIGGFDSVLVETFGGAEFTLSGGHMAIDATLSVTGNSAFDSDLDVDGVTNLDVTDIDGTLDVDGDTEMDTVNVAGSLTVADFADFNDSLDVAMSVNIQDNLDVNDSLRLNSAENEGRILTVTDSQGGLGVTIETVNTSGSTSATTLTTHRLVVQDDAVYNGDMNVNGALAVTSNITSAAAPTSPNHITNKQYVDDKIAAAITPPQVFDYEVTSSTNNDTVYYINGDLLLYNLMENGQENYEITVYGTDLNDVSSAALRLRGDSLPLTGANENWIPALDGNSATFNISYSAMSTLANNQTDGYVSTTLTITNATATYNSGMTIRFYLDSTNAVASGATFTDPE